MNYPGNFCGTALATKIFLKKKNQEEWILKPCGYILNQQNYIRVWHNLKHFMVGDNLSKTKVLQLCQI